MLYKLNPLDVKLDFDDRVYKLGEAIDVDVEFLPASDVTVRKAWIDLVYEQHTSRSETGIVIGYGMGPRGGSHHLSANVPGSPQVNQRAKTFIHSGIMFLKDSTCRSDRLNTHRVKLRIEPVPPKRFSDAMDGSGAWSFIWRLRASVDVVRGRNVERSYQVRIGLPESPFASGVSDRPKMSTPKKPTGPAENGLPWWDQGRRPTVTEDSDEGRE